MLPYKDYSGMQLPGVFLGKKDEKTFQYDDSLPPLPVPPLEHSLYRYLDSVRPLVSEEEFKNTEALAKQFAAGIGKDLHKKLLEKAKHSKNWLEEWWEKYAYLSTRTPHAPYMTMSGPGSYNLDIWQAKEGTQIERISLLTWLGAVYWNILRREQLAIDRGSKTIVWSMNQYQRMFNSCKIPQPNIDALKLYFKTEAQGPCPSHVIVLVNGRIYMMDTLDANNEPYTPPMFERAFTLIKQAAYSGSAGPGLGSLTAMEREPWFKLREHLIELHSDNVKLLELLQSAVYCISLDDRSPANLNEAVQWASMDDCTNRWFDKSYALIIFRNGLISSACDHTGYDGMVFLLNLSFTHQSLIAEQQLVEVKVVDLNASKQAIVGFTDCKVLIARSAQW